MAKLTVFRCRQCRDFINDLMTECPYCGSAVDRSKISAAVEEKKQAHRTELRRHHAKHMRTGLAALLLGIVMFVALLALEGYFHLLHKSIHGYWAAIGISLSGLGDFVYGLTGWLGEV